jgi:hypothetical protein
MIVIREVFIAKPGMAGKMAKMMKSVMQELPNFRGRVLTDMTGQFNKVVLETELDNLAAFEQRMKEYAQNTEFRDKMSGYTEMYTTGKRDIFQVI